MGGGGKETVKIITSVYSSVVKKEMEKSMVGK